MRITGKDDHGARFSGCDDEDWDLFIKRLQMAGTGKKYHEI
jgi:hypothetical protein